MRLLLAASLLIFVGCAHYSQEPHLPSPRNIHTTPEINLSDYSAPFGHAPDQPDLEEVFLSLPDQLAGDMPIETRKGFIKQSEHDAVNHMFDRTNKYITFFNDNPYNPFQASSTFTIKILPSSKYPYVVAIHLGKPSTLDVPPSPSNTFFLVPRGGQWVDVTEELLPQSVSRDWYFQPLWSSKVIEAGPYQRQLSGHWSQGVRVYDLVWRNDRFSKEQPSSHDFTP